MHLRFCVEGRENELNMNEIPLLFGSPSDAAFFNPLDFVKYAQKKGHGYDVRLPRRVILCFDDALFPDF